MGARERREREKVERRNQILDAARGILFNEGMAAVSMNQIAAAAELSVGTLYLYFKNKEELFAALQQEGLDLLEQMMDSAFERSQNDHERLELMALAYLEFSELHRKYFDIISYFLTSPEMMFPQDLKVEIDSHGDHVLAIVGRALAGGRELDAEQRRSVRRCSLVYWSTLQGMLMLRKLKETMLVGEDFEQLYRFGCQRMICALEKELRAIGIEL
ncbi:MAG: helix-turn-helix domain-containing protein [Candidatus Alcyoniella australis]|nr:helix-turn-helix domain-containing protein [Candidatus Alcyoniella australis]